MLRKRRICKCGCDAAMTTEEHNNAAYLPEHRVRKKLYENLDRLTDKSGDCWLWTGELSNQGYGRILTRRRRVLVHRVVWERAYGSIPLGMLVLHQCDVKRCVKPSHLALGDKRRNIREAIDRGQAKFPKLSDEKVVAILAEPRVYGYRVRLAKKYGVTVDAIGMIIGGYNWKHIPRPAAP